MVEVQRARDFLPAGETRTGPKAACPQGPGVITDARSAAAAEAGPDRAIHRCDEPAPHFPSFSWFSSPRMRRQHTTTSILSLAKAKEILACLEFPSIFLMAHEPCHLATMRILQKSSDMTTQGSQHPIWWGKEAKQNI